MSVLPLNLGASKPASATEIERVVTAAAAELASSLESIKISSHHWKDSALATALIHLAIDRCLARVAQTGLWGPENRLPSNQLWKIVGEYLEYGWLQRRAREKPLGYAGDYELLSRIVNRTCCEHPLGVCFDRYFQTQSAPEAVRQRTALGARVLTDSCLNRSADELRVVGVGCGPAFEIDQGLALLPSAERAHVHVTLLDLCGEALAAAEQRIVDLLPQHNLVTRRENLPRLPERNNAQEQMGNPHLILCPGLCDYLDTHAAGRLLRLFWQQLSEGGMMLVGNFAPDHATRAYMEWIGNWYLTYRSFEEIGDLAVQAGIPANCLQIGTESTGSDWFLLARKV